MADHEVTHESRHAEFHSFPPIKGFLETSFLDWPGRLAAVIFLPGCNFRCPYCHNHELIDGAAHLDDIPVGDVLDRIAELDGWVDGIVVSGGEPTLHPGLRDLLVLCRSHALDVKLDTNGSRPEVVASLIADGLVHSIDMDLKAPLDKESYRRTAGVEVNPSVIEASISVIQESGIPHRFRTTYVPDLLSHDEIWHMASRVAPRSTFILQAFDPKRTLDPALRDAAAPAREEIHRLSDRIAHSAA